MEACRPLIDAYLLTLLRQRTLSRTDFAETRRGDCRIRPRLAEQLAATTATWWEYVAPVAERVAQTIGDHAPTPLAVPTPLTGTQRSAARGQRATARQRTARLPALPATCRSCGRSLPNVRRRDCDDCRRSSAERAGRTGRAAASAALARLRHEGRDPAHGGEAGRRRGTKNSAHQEQLAQWQPEPGRRYDPEEFRGLIAPALRDRSIADLANATGLSEHYCSLIRLGKRTPHARHWDALSRVAGVPALSKSVGKDIR